MFDYIYGVLHAPNYRETYREFLKIDFPRVPFPRDPATFRALSEAGEALRRLHLMEDAAIGATPYPFEGEGAEGLDCVLDKPRFEPELPSPAGKGGGWGSEAKPSVDAGVEPPPAGVEPPPAEGDGWHRRPLPAGEGLLGRVYINAAQYFAGVSETAWQFHIGGYQPAQKWLKDRKGRALSWDDIRHYQKIIKILSETDRIMRGIELPLD